MQAPHAQPIARPSIAWGCMRLRASAWMVGVALSVVVALVLGALPQVAAEGVDDPCGGVLGRLSRPMSGSAGPGLF